MGAQTNTHTHLFMHLNVDRTIYQTDIPFSLISVLPVSLLMAMVAKYRVQMFFGYIFYYIIKRIERNFYIFRILLEYNSNL